MQIQGINHKKMVCKNFNSFFTNVLPNLDNILKIILLLFQLNFYFRNLFYFCVFYLCILWFPIMLIREDPGPEPFRIQTPAILSSWIKRENLKICSIYDIQFIYLLWMNNSGSSYEFFEFRILPILSKNIWK